MFLRNQNNFWSIYNNGSSVAFAYNNTLASFIQFNGTYNTSDRRLKSGIKPLESILDRVMKLEPSRYIYNSHPSNQKIGLIAQDVDVIFPEFVGKTVFEGEQTYGVDYGNLSVVAIKAIQEINQKLQLEQEKNKTLEALLLQLSDRLERLEKDNPKK